MFQRLSNLLFGEVEEVAAEIKGPNPCVTEADEEGWMIVNLPGEYKSLDLYLKDLETLSLIVCVMFNDREDGSLLHGYDIY